MTTERHRNKNSVAAFIIGLLFWVPLFNYLTSAIAIYLGIKALREIRDEKKPTGKVLASAAIILGIIPYYLATIYLLRTYFGISVNILGIVIAVLLPLILLLVFSGLKLRKLI